MSKFRFEEIAINSTEKKKPVESDKYTYLGLEHLDPGTLKVSRFGSDVAPIGEKLVMKKGDVLFGKRRAYQKKVAIAPFDGIFSAHGMVLRPKTEVIDSEFFPLFISSDYFLDAAIKISVGSLSPTINWKDLKNLEFELPDLETQRQLAKVLWALIDTIENYKVLMTKTDELVKSQFIELLSDPRAEKVLIKDAFTLQMGKTPARNDSKCWDSKDHKWMTISDLEDGATYTGDTKEYISDYAVKTSGIKITPKNSVIMSFKLTIGRALITAEDIFTNEAIMTFLPKRKIDVKFLRYFLSNKDWSEKSNQAVKGITLNKESIGNSTITIPPEEVMEQITMLINQSDKSKFHIRKLIQMQIAIWQKGGKIYANI